MDIPSRLEENFNVLLAEMEALKHLRDQVARRGDRRMDGWLQKVEGKESEVDDIQKEINELKRGFHLNLNIRNRLNRKVIDSFKAVKFLKEEANANSESIEMLLSEMAREKPRRFSHGDLRTITSNFSFKVGSGYYGTVYRGQFPNGMQVAVKVLTESDVVKDIFMTEVRIMGKTYHQNLVKFYGFCFDGNTKALVYEYLENGSLDKVLYENHLSLDWEKLYSIATEIAKGLSYLHEYCQEKIIHHDVKASNVLLDLNLSPKVTDFGLAKLTNRDVTHHTLSRTRGTAGYAAPEMCIPSSRITEKCDVYSFGMMLFEVLGRRNNNQGQKWFPKQVWQKFEEGHLDELIEDCGIKEKDREKAKLLSLIAIWCTQFVPRIRPSMSTVVKMLEREIPVKTPPNPFP